MIKHFKANKFGRDFVIGDLHGRKDLLDIFLDQIDFQPKIDRCFSVGDLIDRGPQSFECLQLILEPWFFSVKGNHEQLIEDWMTGGPTGRWWFRNGGDWFNNLSQEDKNIVTKLLPTLQELPWLITVDNLDGSKFHIVHAELPNTTGITDETLAYEDGVRKFLLMPSGDGQVGIWGRELWGEMYANILDERAINKIRRRLEMLPHKAFNDKLSPVFSGHTIMRRPTKLLGQTNLDTAAFAEGSKSWCCLTATEPRTGKFWRIDIDGIEEVELLTVI